MKKLIQLSGLVIAIALATPVLFANPYNHLYVNVGGTAYYLRTPSIQIGNKNGSASPLIKANNNGFTPRYDLALGYEFCNCNNNWITYLFGRDNAVELRMHYFNTSSRKSKSNIGEGQMWFIDGSGLIWTRQPPYTANVVKATLNTRNRRFDSTVLFKGVRSTPYQGFTITPFIGIVYTAAKSENSANITYDDNDEPGTTDYITNYESYKTDTNYYGLTFGEKFNFLANKVVSPFVAFEIQGLEARSKLKAHQEAKSPHPTPLPYVRNVNDSKNKFTYRAKATVGVDIKFTQKPNSPVVTLEGGIDRDGYQPKVITPNSATSNQKVHLTSEAENNGFVSLELHIPLG